MSLTQLLTWVFGAARGAAQQGNLYVETHFARRNDCLAMHTEHSYQFSAATELYKKFAETTRAISLMPGTDPATAVG